VRGASGAAGVGPSGAPGAARGAPAVGLDAVSVRYPGRRDAALSVSVDVAAGEMVGVAGRTGAGKSTLALLAGGFIPRVVRAHVAGAVRIDGLDGLSTGIALIAAVTLGTISLGLGTTAEPFVALFCFILAGALAGFLRWNFHPASIFSGTSGIMFVGYSLAVLSVLGAGKIAVALLVLGVPIMDTFWIIVRRMAARRSPFGADRGHIHHRLLDLGLSHRDTVLVIYGVCVLLAILSLANTSRAISNCIRSSSPSRAQAHIRGLPVPLDG